MSIIDFFDPYNIEHIKTYDTFRKTGIWPTDFVTSDIDFPIGWHSRIVCKIANAWADIALRNKNIMGVRYNLK